MSLTSVPLAPRVRWWTKLVRFPRRLWAISGETTTMLTDLSSRPPSKRKRALIRLGSLVTLILVSPAAFVLRFRARGATGYDALDARVREIWRRSPSDAVALLKRTYEELVARDGFARMRRLTIEPYGSFEPWDTLAVHRFLFDCEMALGHHEEALAVAASLPGRVEAGILQQVDCLVALGRQADAISLLERNLDIDSWRGPLRRRLAELGGHLRVLS